MYLFKNIFLIFFFKYLVIDRKNQQDKEYFEDNGETKVYYLNDLENSGYIYNDSELILTPIVYQSLPSIYWNQFE